MQVRQATEDDADAIRSIARSSMEASYSLSPSTIEGAITQWYGDDELAEKFADDDVVVLVVEDDGEVVAFSESALVENQADILWLHVDPMYRGEGVGTRLFERTREYLDDHGATRFRGRVLADNAEGNDFYERHGLRKTGEGRVEIDGSSYVENIYGEREETELRAVQTADGDTVYVDESDPDRGSDGAFLAVYSDPDRETKWGFFCANCDSLVDSMDSMGRMECSNCGNRRKPTRWDAAYM